MKVALSLLSVCLSVAGHCAEAPAGLLDDGLPAQVEWQEQPPVDQPVGYALIEPVETERIAPVPVMPQHSGRHAVEVKRGVKPVPDSPFTDRGGAVMPRQTAVRAAALSSRRALQSSDFDPFKGGVKWQFGAEVTVGQALVRVAKFLGYTLIIRDKRVGNVYSMLLPHSHRSVQHIKAQSALELLGGQGMIVVVDHANRTVMHRIKRNYDLDYDVSLLPPCADPVTFATMPAGAMSDRVLIVGGVQCVY